MTAYHHILTKKRTERIVAFVSMGEHSQLAPRSASKWEKFIEKNRKEMQWQFNLFCFVMKEFPVKLLNLDILKEFFTQG